MIGVDRGNWDLESDVATNGAAPAPAAEPVGTVAPAPVAGD